MKIYQEIASTIQARQNCIKNNNTEWISKHESRLHEIENNNLPHGSGIDNGCSVDIDKSTGEKIIINTSFHHMDENGMYDGWTSHKIIITSSLVHGFVIKITGINKNGIKDYLRDLFYESLDKEYTTCQYCY